MCSTCDRGYTERRDNIEGLPDDKQYCSDLYCEKCGCNTLRRLNGSLVCDTCGWCSDKGAYVFLK